MTENSQPVVDLFGDPVPANWGRRGRPEHVPTDKNRRKVNMLLALGWTNQRIAAAMFVTLPTLRKHYFSELRYREVARDRLDAEVAMRLWAGVEDGNVGAIREFRKLLERNDLMMPRSVAEAPRRKVKPPKPPKLGKKEAERQAAGEPDKGTPLGELMARRQGQRVQ